MNVDAERIAEEVIGHIDTMYPKMWEGVSKNARRSLRGCIINEVRNELLRAVHEHSRDAADPSVAQAAAGSLAPMAPVED